MPWFFLFSSRAATSNSTHQHSELFFLARSGGNIRGEIQDDHRCSEVKFHQTGLIYWGCMILYIIMISRPQHKLTSGNTMLLYFLCWKFSTTYVFCIRILFTLHSILAPSRHSKTSTKNVDSRSAYDRSRLCFKADTGDNRDSLSERARVTSSLSDLVRYFLGSSRHAPRAEYHLTLRDIDLRAVYDTVTMKRPAFVFDGRVTLDGDARTGKISLKVTTIGRGDKEHNSHTPPFRL